MIQVRLLKRRRREGGKGRSKAWWSMEGSKLGGQWKVKEKHLFTSCHFPPQQSLFRPSIFSLDLKVLLYHGPRPLLTHSLPFFRSINYDYAFQCNKSFTPSLSIWFWLKHWFLSFPWNYGVAHCHLLWASSHTSEWRTASRVISRFDLNATSSWWRTWNSRSVHSSWSWTPLGLLLLYFSKLSHLGDLVTSRPRFWWQI